MNDVKQTYLAQYANSPTITAIIENFNDAIDPSKDIDLFYKNIFDIDTAMGVGLDYWGAIVDVSRNIKVQDGGVYFGFKQAESGATGAQPFNQAPFYNGSPATTNYRLADDAYRKLILVKALANITDGSIKSLNYLLNFLFSGEGRCYVHDTGSMQIRYVFEFNLSAVELAIMLNSSAIPKPAGVGASVMQVDRANTFGFKGSGLQPFNQGVFFSGSQLKPIN